jgi:hypothetical protein
MGESAHGHRLLTLLFVAALWAASSASGSYRLAQERIAATGESLQRMNHAVEDQTRRQFRLVNVFLAACAQAGWKRTPTSIHGQRPRLSGSLLEGFQRRTDSRHRDPFAGDHRTATSIDGFSETAVPSGKRR